VFNDANIPSMIFIGLDQTGAILKNGKPKPLPIAIVYKNQKTFLSVGYIPNCSFSEIQKFILTHYEDDFKTEDVHILMDCVLGLPHKIYPPNTSFREFLRLAAQQEGYGRIPARIFFKNILGQSPILTRQTEDLANANSVFLEYPFQKNIQTGTFRLWKDLGANPESFYIPYMERKKRKAFPIYEGYPSMSWKILFKTSSRKPDHFLKLSKKFFHNLHIDIHSKKLITKDANLADAATLALHMSRDYSFFKYPKTRTIKKEGWIFSLKE
jgi:hypothetical protein